MASFTPAATEFRRKVGVPWGHRAIYSGAKYGLLNRADLCLTIRSTGQFAAGHFAVQNFTPRRKPLRRQAGSVLPVNLALEIMPIKCAKVAAIFVLALNLFSCVSIDQRASNETIDKDASLKLSGIFYNNASYHSEGEFVAIGNLAELFKAPAQSAQKVKISEDLPREIRVTWIKNNEEVVTKIYTVNNGLEFSSDGTVVITSQSGPAMSEGVIGYEKHHARLFINKEGSLCAIQSGGGAGLFGPFPIGIYAKNIAIFQRAEK